MVHSEIIDFKARHRVELASEGGVWQNTTFKKAELQAYTMD